MKSKNSRIITSCFALALAGSAQADSTWSTINWTGDSQLSFITNSNVTHSGDFVGPSGAAAAVNGFTFEAISIADGFNFTSNTIPGTNFTIGSVLSGTYNASAGVSGVASTPLSTGLIYSGGVKTYNLTGLSTNTNYEFYFFSPDWGDTRTGDLDGSDDDVGNTFTANQSAGAGDKIIKYAYNTGASTSFTMSVDNSSGLHQYAFVNIASPADTYTWNTTTNGALWTLNTNWDRNVIADGTGKTAAFNQVDITADTAVDLDGNRTIGNLIFGDADPATGGSWILDGGGGALTLAGTTPTITVNALATNQAVTMNAGLEGTSGFTKNGTGTLYLAGGTSNTLSGPITVSAGSLGCMGSVSLQNMTGDITVASGATFNAIASFGPSITKNFILSGTGTGGSGALNMQGNANLTGAITLAADTLITHDWNVAYVNGSITGTNTNLELKTLVASQPGFFMSGPISLGTGALTLTGIGTIQSADFDFSGTLNYTGETVITSGNMRLSGTARLPDSSTVRITSGAVLNLDFAGTDTVAALYLNGALMPAGTYGSLASTATNKSADFLGEGILDVVSASSYSTWASANSIPGQPASGDFDNDGLTNIVEYALGLSPTVSSVPPGTFNGSLLSFNKGAEAMANGDVTYEIEQSTTLGGWTVVVPNAPASASISYTLPSGQPKEFARLKITQIP